MEKIKILAAGRHPEIMETLLRLINNNPEWLGVGALSQHEAKSLFVAQTFDLLLISSGLTPDETSELTDFCKGHVPGVIVLQHYGGGSGLLFSEISAALAGR